MMTTCIKRSLLYLVIDTQDQTWSKSDKQTNRGAIVSGEMRLILPKLSHPSFFLYTFYLAVLPLHIRVMPTELHPTADFHKAGYLYLLVCWGVFLSYCVLYQFDRLITLFLRWQRQRRRRYIKKRDDEISIQPPHEMINHWMRPLEHSRTIPYIATMISTKHLIGMSLFIIANIIFIWFSPFKLHPLMDHYEWPIVAILDRRMMYVGMANFSFTMVLGTRNSIITALCGLSFEQLIPFHRWCARLGLAETVLHVVYRA